MAPSKKDNLLPETVHCPHCGRPEKTEVIINKGFMRGRPSRRGGPFYQFKCAVCHKEFECFFEEEVFTRKQDLWKEFIARMSSWIRVRAVSKKHSGLGEYRKPKERTWSFESSRYREQADFPSTDSGSLPLIFRIHPELLSCFRVLGLSHSASAKAAKKRYKKLVKQYHPDRIGHLSEEKRRETTNKLVEINKAYGTIKEYFS